MTGVRRRRTVAVVAAAMVLLAVVAFAATRLLGGGGPPATGAAAFAPQDTLVYVHLSTDTGRDAVSHATDVAGRFDSYETIRDGILARLTGQPVKGADVEPWLGEEAALALMDTGQGTAGSLVIVKVTDTEKARSFMTDNPRRTATREYKGDRVDEFGTVNVAFKDGWLLIGQPITVQGALDRANGNGDALADSPTFTRAMKGASEDRVADAYVTAGGLRRLLVPQGDVLGTVAAVLDRPGLKGVGLSAVVEDERVRVRAHSVVDGDTGRAFDPKLEDAVPADAMAYLGVSGISGSLANLVAAAAGGANAGGVGPLLERLRTELGKQTGGALERDLLSLLDGEVALVLSKATPAPVLSLVTQVKDEDATAAVLKRLQAPLVKLLTPEGEDAPRWRIDDVGDGIRAQTLATPTGAEITYAVFDGRLVVGTGPEAIRRIKDAKGSLPDSDRYEKVESRPEKPTSLGFLDFKKLLELGEQTGLKDSRAYQAARSDLHRVQAIGISSHSGEGETTAEITFLIP